METILYLNGKQYAMAKTRNESKYFIFDYDCIKKLKTNVFTWKKNKVYAGKYPLYTLLKKRKCSFINGINTDYRLENLEAHSLFYWDYKKRREIPQNCGITKEEIPKYISYVPEKDNKGPGWKIKIGNFKWVSDLTKTLSLKCKFEMTKKVYRLLMKKNPKVIDYRMNIPSVKVRRLENEYISLMGKIGIVVKQIKRVNLEEDLVDLPEKELRLIENMKLPRFKNNLK